MDRDKGGTWAAETQRRRDAENERKGRNRRYRDTEGKRER